MSILNLLKFDKVFIYIILLTIILLIDLCVSIIIEKKIIKKISKGCLFAHIIISFIIILILTWSFCCQVWQRDVEQFNTVFLISSNLFSIYIAKLVFVIVSLPSFFFKNNTKLLIVIGLCLSILSLILFDYSSIYGRFNYEVKRNEIHLNIPKQLNGLKIVQLSDIHIGTFQGHEDKLQKVVDLVNQQNPDLVFITGDIINCFAEEVEPFIKDLMNIKAKYGKYAVLGNHDYGDYYKWDNKIEMIENQKLMVKYFKELDICLLNNDSKKLKIKDTSVWLAGIENWGLLPFRQLGDLKKALQNINDNSTVLLLSHDPILWDMQIKKNKKVKMTFSGHTHGYQIGIKFANKYWTPFAGKKPWNGIYENNGAFLYISKGIGGSFFPGRVGMWPEISVITLISY
jgi:uncharacterized protein